MNMQNDYRLLLTREEAQDKALTPKYSCWVSDDMSGIHFCLRWNDPANFRENLYLCIFVLLSFIWSDGDLSS